MTTQPIHRPDHASHPDALANLLEYLPRLEYGPGGYIDFTTSDPVIVALLDATATQAVTTINLGVDVIGELLAAHHASGIEAPLKPDAVGALGLLIAEVVNFSAALTRLPKRCRPGQSE